MECLEVVVNGERHCVAARSGAHSLGACITQLVGNQDPDRAIGSLSVSGLSADFKTRLVWGLVVRSLAVGDRVTIRVLKANTADTPVRSPSGLRVDDDIPEVLSGLGDRLANDPLNFFGNDNARHLLFWGTVTILAFILWLIR